MLRSVFGILTAILIINSVTGSTIPESDNNKKGTSYKGNVLLDEKAKGHVSKFIYYISGNDYENRKVIVFEWGRWDIRTLAEKGGEEVEKFETCTDQLVELVKSDYFTKAGNDTEYDDTMVVIIDFDGLDLHQIATPASLQLFVKGLGKLQATYDKFAYGFIVNANSLVNQVIHLAKPFMGKFLERMEVYGANSRSWIPNILKKIPRSQLHVAYGGKKDFRPLAVYSLI